MLPLCTLPVTAVKKPLSVVTSSTSLRHIRRFCSWAHPVVFVFHVLRDDSRPAKKTLRQLLLKSAQTGRTGSTIVLECTNAGQKEGRPRTDSIGGWCTGALGETDTSLPFLRGAERALLVVNNTGADLCLGRSFKGKSTDWPLGYHTRVAVIASYEMFKTPIITYCLCEEHMNPYIVAPVRYCYCFKSFSTSA